MNWFGDPWPSREWRAPVCANEGDHVDPPPPGTQCTMCSQEFAADAQGVAMPHLSADGWILEGFVHLKCLVSNVGGFV